MPTFRILVFQDVLLVGRFEAFRTAEQKNNNIGETSNFAVASFLIYYDSTIEENPKCA
jgi:hypothetical protein